jgi:pre-mRNA-splicing factor 38A
VQVLERALLCSNGFANFWCWQWLSLILGLCAAELLVDKALALDHIGGVYGGNVQPTPFLCLAQKMLQIQPDKDIVVEFIKNEDYKLVTD